MEDFLEKTKHRQAAEILQEWVPRLGLHGGIALDLGCGSGAEAEYLAKQGFMVDAIDKNETVIKYAKERCEGLKVDALVGDFREFNFRPNYYTLVTAINSLPFILKDEAKKLFRDVKQSLKVGGVAILCVYGPEHVWSDRKDMSFWSKDEFGEIWDGYHIHLLEEYKGLWPLVSGEEIYQHRIHLVAQKA